MNNMVGPKLVEEHLASESSEHKGYGTSSDMYAQFFHVRIAVFSTVLGDEFDVEMKQVCKNRVDQLESITCKHAKA